MIEAVESGATRRQVAERLGASVASAVRWVQEWRATGRLAPLPRGGDWRSGRIEAHGAFVQARIQETPDITLCELRELLYRERGLQAASQHALALFRSPHCDDLKKG